MSNPSKIVAFLLVCVLSFSAACGGKKQKPIEWGFENGVFIKVFGSEIETIDPHFTQGEYGFRALVDLSEGLTSYHPKTLEPLPGVAKSWKITNNGKTYTFHLRKDAKWTNGDPVTAHDFIYSYKRLLDPEMAGIYSFLLYYVKNAEDYKAGKIKDFSKVAIKALDDHTIRFQLKNPTPFFLSLFAFPSMHPVHKPTIEKFKAFTDRSTPWTKPENIVTNGPFKLKSWKLNDRMIMEKNPLYWDAANVKLNGVHIIPIESDPVEERTFRAGETHATSWIPNNKIEWYKKNHPEWTRLAPAMSIYFYQLNQKRAPLDNVNVRRAIAYAIDRDKIAKYVSKGGEVGAFSFTPPGAGNMTFKPKLEFNVKKAQEYLAKAGYPGGKGFPKIELLYNTSERHQQIGAALQEMLKKNLGIQLELVNQEWKVYLQTNNKGDYFLTRQTWGADYNDPDSFLNLFDSKAAYNTGGFNNPDYDKILNDALKTADKNTRFKLYQRAEDILADQVPVIPLLFRTYANLVHDRVVGWHSNSMDFHPTKHISFK